MIHRRGAAGYDDTRWFLLGCTARHGASAAQTIDDELTRAFSSFWTHALLLLQSITNRQSYPPEERKTTRNDGMVLCVCPPFPKCSCQGIVSKRFLHTTSPHGEIQSQRQLGEFERHCVGTTSTRRKSQTKRTEHLVVVIIIIIIIIGATTDMQAVDGATVLKSKIKIFWPVCRLRYVLYCLMLRTFSLRL